MLLWQRLFCKNVSANPLHLSTRSSPPPPPPESLRRVEELSGKSVEFIKADLLDKAAIDAVFDKVNTRCRGCVSIVKQT